MACYQMLKSTFQPFTRSTAEIDPLSHLRPILNHRIHIHLRLQHHTHSRFSLSSHCYSFTVFPINLMQFDLFHGTHIIFALVWFGPGLLWFEAFFYHFFACSWKDVCLRTLSHCDKGCSSDNIANVLPRNNSKCH